MAGQHSRLLVTLSSIGLSLNFVLTALLPTRAQVTADSVPNSQALSTSSSVQVPFDPPGRGKPDDSAGGGSRDGGKCSQDAVATSPSLTPLMPINNQGLTLAEHPTFFVYVPKTSARKAFFSLKDEKEDYYYQITFPVPTTPGVLSFKLPSDAPVLEIGKRYQWSLVTICGEKLAVDDPRVEGQIQRVEMNSAHKNQLKNLPPLERAALYRADGLWYDSLTSLAELRQSQPGDPTLTAAWENLLKSVGLEKIATKSLLQ